MTLTGKFHRFSSLAVVTALAVGSFPQAGSNASTPLSTVNYSPSYENFLNPERGYMFNVGMLEDAHFLYVRKAGYTITRAYVRLDDFRNQPLSDAFLQKLRQGFQKARASGIKLVLRFAYNLPEDLVPGGAPDATSDQVIQHLNQLKPVLAENSDVILVLQAGFIGAWGEWHNSANRLDNPKDRVRITRALLAALPPNRSIQLRTPEYIREAFPSQLTEAEAFRGGYNARTGHHNDCFLSNADDAGTYWPDIARTQAYIAQRSNWTPVGGDTCPLTPAEQRTDCVTTQNELARFHWSYLSGTYYEGNINRWKREGCYETIGRRLGYRFELVSSSLPNKVVPGGQFAGTIKVKNVGYASPFNLRNLQLILRHQATGKVYRIGMFEASSKTNDPRFWLPSAGAIDVKVSGGIPANAPQGSYQVLLNLPDGARQLYSNPLYSIRLANNNTWEEKTGFNSLLRSVQVDNTAPRVPYTGTNWFR